MKILIVSDTHGNNDNLKRVIKKVKPIDLLIHLGDFASNIDHIRSLVDCPVEAVCGNNDFYCDVKREKLIEFGSYKVFLTHGHTHRPIIELQDNIWAINPGSISLPRQKGKKPTYIIMEID